MEVPVSSPASEAPAVSFSSFVVSLATSAMTHLGQGPNPHVDLALARHSIDLLAVLQEKTKGNLDDEERQLLETVLTETRTKYVEQSEG